MNIKRFISLLILITSFLTIFGQEEHPNCISAKEFNLPFDDNIISFNEIYYQAEDKYTYWYKVYITSDCQFSYRVSSIGKDDDYELLMYKYEGEDFCNDRIVNDIMPISIRNKGVLSVKKGELYYLSIIHIQGQGCGHVIELDDGVKNIHIKAIQNDCVEEAIELVTKEENIVQVQVVDTVKPVHPLNLNKKVKGYVVNSVTQKNIEADILVLNIRGEKIQEVIKFNNSGGFELNNLKGDTIVLSITKFGYENLLDTIILKSDSLKLELNPIKVGDKLVMYQIYFHPNTYALKNESKNELKKLCQFMLENDKYIFEIQGHTNGNRSVKLTKQYENLGEEWNFKGSSKKLSKLRAEKIKSYLIENGVLENQLQTEGFGGDQMIVAKPKNMKQAMKNIRVEVKVIQ